MGYKVQKKANRTSESVPALLIEIMFQILLLLPVDSVLRCKSVCKEWYSLISHETFIKARLALKKKYLFYKNNEVLTTSYLNDLMFDKPMFQVSIPYPLIVNDYAGLIGSSNGLICISQHEGLSIYNPITRICNRVYGGFVGAVHLYHVAYGFGYDVSNDDYKVVAVAKVEKKVQIYSMKSGLWKKNVSRFPDVWLPANSICLNGCLHWMDVVPNWSDIVCFDLRKETFGKLLTPEYDAGDKVLDLGVLGDLLCVLCNYKQNRLMDLWVMQVYGRPDSWTKLLSVAYPDHHDGWARFWKTLWMSNDGKILLRFGYRAVLYDSKNDSFTFFKETDNCQALCSFDESLVSPNAPGIRYRLRSSKVNSGNG